MRMFKSFFITLGAILLFALPASSAGVTTYNYGPSINTLLLRSQTTTIGTAGFCMDLLEDITASIAGEACDVTGSNEVIWPRNAQVEEIVIRHIVTGTASDACLFEVEESGTVVLAGEITATDAAAGSVTTHPYKIDIADGDLIGLVVSESTSCASSAEYVVELWGRWVDTDF